MRHAHEWIEIDGWRICRCLEVQRHDGKRWRKAPREIQSFVQCMMMMNLLAAVCEQPELITEPLSRMGDTLRLLLP